jgi:hypothetical protein
MAERTTRGWRKSTHCESGSCVEVAFTDAAVLMRASDTGPELRFAPDRWSDFIEAIKNAEFGSFPPRS